MTARAPLLSISEAPAPANGGAEWFEGADGARLRAALFMPEGQPRGSVVLSPGRTEPIEKYFEVVGELQARGFAVLAHDWRGHGLSARMTADPLKGHARGWRTFIRDFSAMLDHFGARLPKPWIALGHSMGGGLTLLALAEGEPRFAAAFLTSPMLAVRTGPVPPPLARVIAGLMRLLGQGAAYVPGQPPNLVDQPFESNVLTHDRARWNRIVAQLRACPELQLGGVTWAWLSFALGLGGRIVHKAERIHIPLAITAAGDDRLCLTEATRALYAQAPDARYLEIPGAYHELLMETDAVHAQVWAEFDALAGRVAPLQAAPSFSNA